jgi:bacterioferritin-associated ferredoxin
MFLCLCYQVSQWEFRRSLQKNPAVSMEEIMEQLKVGKDCGTCLKEAKELYHQFSPTCCQEKSASYPEPRVFESGKASF